MTIYQDYIGRNFKSLDELARYRIEVQAPLLGDAVCPAAEYTFAVSTDQGATWNNPSTSDKHELLAALAAAQGCCRNLAAQCPAKNTGP